MAAMAFRNGDTNVVTQDDRDRAKVLCLAVSYGMGSYALAHHLRTTSRSDAEDLKSEFLSKFPGMATFIKRKITILIAPMKHLIFSHAS
mmetsp:Transcript_2536/g.3866  ORF Transcript_2536/g.3866 Transcript_2536/m.3866 type:complete len:89 (+) Transcript_2536:2156-2422(+)